MRHGRILLCALFLFFLVLAGRSLVRGPEEEKTRELPQPVPEAAVLLFSHETGQESEGQRASGGRDPEKFRADQPRRPVVFPSVPGDGNGQILKKRTWHRSVYWVCPPEGMPG